MKISRKLPGDVFTLAVLFLATGAFHACFVDLSDPNAVAAGSPLIRALWTFFYVVVLYRAIPCRHRIVALIRRNKFLIALVLFALASTMWSIEPRTTLLRALSLLFTTLIGADFAIRYSIREQISMLCIALGTVVLLGVAAQIFFPGLVPMLDWNPGGAWNGAFAYKNIWARFVVLTAVVFVCRFRHSRLAGPLLALLVTAAVVLVLTAKSVGGLVVLIATLAIMKSFGALRWRPALLTVAVLAALVISIAAVDAALHNLGSVTGFLGRDPTLTGRTDIWTYALGSIEKSPILGHGYDAFWSASSQDAARIRSAVHWDTPYAHNGYIDLALDLGLAGLILYFAGVIVTGWRAIKHFRRNTGTEVIFPLAYLCFMLLYQLPEGYFVIGNSVLWIAYVAIACSVTVMGPQRARTMEHEESRDAVREAVTAT